MAVYSIPPVPLPPTMPLSEIKVRTTKAKAKPFKLADEKGMFVLVNPNGSKLWRLKYRFLKKEKLLALGAYPEVSLKDARGRRDTARKLLANGVDPMENKRAQDAATADAASNSFEVVAREWLKKMSAAWVPDHMERITTRFERDVFPTLGYRPIGDIIAPELLKVLRQIEGRGTIETAHRTHQNCSQVFRYAIATGRASRDIGADLRGALTVTSAKHHASITDPKSVGALLRAINEYDGSIVTKCALRLASQVFVRPGELRHAEWSEFDFDTAEWRIPGNKMKMGVMHIVPLSTQAIANLRTIQPVTGHGKYVFPSVRTSNRPMSENTVNAALRRLGYSTDQMTGHGFRSMASTLLNENGWNRDAIERQLAHAERDNVRAAYNYAEFLPERRKMMQWWADHLAALAVGGKVLPLGLEQGKAA